MLGMAHGQTTGFVSSLLRQVSLVGAAPICSSLGR